MVASRLANMQQGGDRKSEDFKTEISALISQPEAAKLLNVSTDSVQFARKVLDQGTHELIQKVDAGELAVSTAAKIAELPEEEQVEIVSLQAEPLIAQRAKERQIRKPESVSANLPEQNPISTRDELSILRPSHINIPFLISTGSGTEDSPSCCFKSISMFRQIKDIGTSSSFDSKGSSVRLPIRSVIVKIVASTT